MRRFFGNGVVYFTCLLLLYFFLLIPCLSLFFVGENEVYQIENEADLYSDVNPREIEEAITHVRSEDVNCPEDSPVSEHVEVTPDFYSSEDEGRLVIDGVPAVESGIFEIATHPSGDSQSVSREVTERRQEVQEVKREVLANVGPLSKSLSADDSITIIDSDSEGEGNTDDKTIEAPIAQELEQLRDVISIYSQERVLLESQSSQYRKFENLSPNDLRRCLGDIVQSDGTPRTELSRTQNLVRDTMTNVLAELKKKYDQFPESFPRADFGAAIAELKGMINRVKIQPERLAGAIRKANRMQATKSANIKVAQNHIREVTEVARYRRNLDAEIAKAAENCARERSRLVDISSLQDKCAEEMAVIKTKLRIESQNRERLALDMSEAGPSGVVEPARPSKSAKRRRAMSEQKRAEVRANSARPNRGIPGKFSNIMVERLRP